MLPILVVTLSSDLHLTKLGHSLMRMGQTQNHRRHSQLGIRVCLLSGSTLGFITEADQFFLDSCHKHINHGLVLILGLINSKDNYLP